MEIGDWTAAPDLVDVYEEIRAQGLEQNLAELEAFGFTTVPNALDPDQVVALRERIVEISEERLGRSLSLDGETEHSAIEFIPYLLYKDPMFKDVVVNPKTLPLTTYLLGKRCILSSLGSHLKGPGGEGLLLHTDSGNGIPDPLSPYAHVCNCNYALTDYTQAGGALAMVPGSHRKQRHVTTAERNLVGNERNPHAIPIEVPAGTAIIWHGNTWHGSYPRQMPGLRVNLSSYYCREYIQPQEDYRRTVPEGFLEGKKDARLARLLGADLVHGWTDEGPLKYYQRKAEDGNLVKSWQS
jgi:hypothetical protein